MEHTAPRATSSTVNRKATAPTAHPCAKESSQTERLPLEVGAAKSGGYWGSRWHRYGAPSKNDPEDWHATPAFCLLWEPETQTGERREALWTLGPVQNRAEEAHEGLRSYASLNKKLTKKPNQNPHKKNKRKKRKAPFPCWKKHKQVISTTQDPGSVARGTSGALGLQSMATVQALRIVGTSFNAQNLNQSATNCFFEKRCLLNNFNCHKMTKMGFKN